MAKVSRPKDSNPAEPRTAVGTTVTVIEDTLVRNCRTGDPTAWRALHRRYYPVAAAFLRKLGAQATDIEDTCQDVFVELYRNLANFRGQAEMKTWLYRLCVTQARRTRSRSRLLRVVRERLQNYLPERPSVPPSTMTETTAMRRVAQALDQLNQGDRLVFVLYEFEGLPGKQIAEIAGCPEATVWRKLHYARRSFRGALGIAEAEVAASR